MDWYFDIVFFLNLAEEEVFVKGVLSLKFAMNRSACAAGT